MTVEVTFFPSLPAKGESLTVIVTDIVGGSIGVDFKGVVTLVLQIVSATEAFVKPAIQMISPQKTSSTGTFFVPSNLKSFVKRPFSIKFEFKSIAFTESLIFAFPEITLPVKHLPK